MDNTRVVKCKVNSKSRGAAPASSLRTADIGGTRYMDQTHLPITRILPTSALPQADAASKTKTLSQPHHPDQDCQQSSVQPGVTIVLIPPRDARHWPL